MTSLSSWHRSGRWWVVLVLLGAPLALARPDEGQPEDPFVQASRERSEKVKSFEAVLKQTDITPKGSLGKTGLLPKGANLQPDRDVTLTSEGRYVVSGKMARYENNQPHPDDTGRVIPHEGIHVTDGEEAKSFYVRGVRAKGRPVGAIEPHASNRHLRNYELYPLSLHLRGLDPLFIAEPVSFAKSTGRSLKIAGAICREYRFSRIGNQVEKTLYVDPDLNYSLRRVKVERGGVLVTQQDIQYKPHPVLGHVPERWARNYFHTDGTLLRTTTVELASLVINLDVARTVFQYQFPPGALIANHKGTCLAPLAA